MPKQRLAPRRLPMVPEIPFASATDAWFWYIRSERLRRDGAKLGSSGMATEQRPCEPDDINRAVMALYRKKIIRQEHLKVLAIYGWNDRPPDPRLPDEERAAFLWDDALDRLATELKAKGIVEGIVGRIVEEIAR